MARRPLVVAVLIAIAAWGCAKSTKTETPAASGERASITLDGKADTFNGAFTAFFPNDVKVHPGATVDFKLPRFSGEPHTVTFGTLVDEGVGKIEALGPQGTINAQEDAILKLPDLFFHATPKGPPSPNQSAAQPCFLDVGLPPGDAETGTPPWFYGGAAACPKVTQPAFSGKQAFFNSGLLQENGASFSMKLANDVAPGTYDYMCLIHREAMTGKLTVVPKAEAVTSASEAQRLAKESLDKKIAALKVVADKMAADTPAKAEAGAGDPAIFDASVAQFGPSDVSVPVGGSVTWSVFAFHTIALDPPEDAVGFVLKQADGSYAFNPKAVANVNAPALPAIMDVFPPGPKEKPLAVNGGTWDGAAFRTSGVIASVPPRFVTYTVKFGKAGTYQLRCLFHPDMKGTVKVG